MTSNINYDGGLTCAMGTKDLDKAIAWYTDVLGFELIYKLDEMAWCELKSPVAQVNIGLSQVEEVQGAGGATLTFGVKDIASARATLEDLKVEFDGETLTIPEMVKLATFYDLDGNKLMFFQDLS